MTRKYDMTIANDSVAAAEYREILNPATGDVVGLAAVATTADLDAAVAAAGGAFVAWSATDDGTRKAACHAIADVLEKNAAELAELRGVGLVVERAGDQHVKVGVPGLAGGEHQVLAADRAELRADENARALLRAVVALPFDVAALGADELSRPDGGGPEVDLRGTDRA